MQSAACRQEKIEQVYINSTCGHSTLAKLDLGVIRAKVHCVPYSEESVNYNISCRTETIRTTTTAL